MKTCMHAMAGAVAAFVLASIIGGCAFTELKREKSAIKSKFTLAGQVSNPSRNQGKVIVILFSEKEGKRVPLQYVQPEHEGHFSFLVKSGTYYLGAFEDLNENLTHDPGEYAGYFGSPDPIVASTLRPGNTVIRSIRRLDIHLDPADNFVDGLEMTAYLQIEQMPVFRMGAIVRLEDATFDPANGSFGYWKPLTFVKQFGMGIYFLEPYDPQRIPVLFVHGANGTPINWKKMASRLDRERYQAWFYYYPSGLRLVDSANILQGIIKALHDKHGFDRLYITAHSMGGLVSRAAILNHRKRYNQEYIKLFVAVSTPWGGIRTAQKGVDNAPAAIPSWRDVAPGSDFIREIYSQPLPSDLHFHLFFSHKGNCSLFMQNNDGVAELKSELDYRAQADAAGIYGFHEDHSSILTSREMIERWLMVLGSAP